MAGPILTVARPFQKEDISKLVEWKGNGILAHKTGLGKTVMALGVWQEIGEPPRVLIVGSSSSMYTWKVKVPEWVNQNIIQITGDAVERAATIRKIKDAYFGGRPLFVCCNYSVLRIELEALDKLRFQLLIADEAHKARNRTTKTWAALKALRKTIPRFIAASATLASRGPQDLWGILNLLDAQRFSSYWRFIHQYCVVVDNGFGQEIVGVKNPTALRNMLYDKYMTRRTYEEVMPELPPVTREVVKLDINQDSLQASVYRQLDKDMVAYITGHSSEDPEGKAFMAIVVPNVLTKLTRLRQLLVCPKLIGVETEGAAISYLKDVVEDDPHTVIFSPFASALPYLKEALEKVPGVTTVRILRGGMKPEEMQTEIQAFKEQQGVMLCSIAFAESFSLDTVHTAYFLGYSWDPNENEQAEGRLRRMDSKNFQGVMVKYLLYDVLLDEDGREILNGKAITVNRFINRIASKAGVKETA